MSYYDIHVNELDELYDRPDLTVIDMRDPQSQAKGTLPNALGASDSVINQLVMKRRSNPSVLVYCYHGNSSRDLCEFLAGLGLKQVYNLMGGWSAVEAKQQDRPALDEVHKLWLTEKGFDAENLNSRVEMGFSPLMMAALNGEHDLVESLLSAGADPKQLNDDEHSALWFACVHGDVGLVQKLIDAGSQLDNRNVNGVTCAIYAASTGKLDVLQTLVDAGADLSIPTYDGVSVLESAATLPVLRYLKPLVRQAV